MHLLRFLLLFSLVCVYGFGLSSCGEKEEVDKNLKKLNIVCLGDSITYGYKLADPTQESFPARLQQQSKGKWRVQNFSVNGATVLKNGDIPITAQEVYQKAMDSHPDVVLLMLGTNDTKTSNWEFVDAFLTEYKMLIKRLQELESQPHVIVCSVPPVFIDYDIGINAEHIEKVNIMIKQAARVMHADYLDIHTSIAFKPSLFIDGIHPNASGAMEIAHLVFEKITSL